MKPGTQPPSAANAGPPAWLAKVVQVLGDETFLAGEAPAIAAEGGCVPGDKMLIYHIVLQEIWAAFDSGLYRHASLENEGFIHCSFAEQLDRVIKRYYSKESEVVVLEIESDWLMSRMIKEPSTNSEIYPHVYGPINLDAVVSVRKKKLARE